MMKKAACILIVYLAAASVSFGALSAYLTLEGDEQGPILGGVTQAGKEGSIMVVAYGHSVFSPRDEREGLATDLRQHEPLRITKELDKSTPRLMRAWANGERMRTFILRFWTPSQTGQEIQYYTVRLYGAQIVSIQQEMLNNRYPENLNHKEREHVTFTYRTIEWTWEDGGLQFGTDWMYAGAGMMISDLNGDGMVNLMDLAIFAGEWLN